MFMDGKHSIETNLPVPSIINIEHTACISLNSYIDHVIGHGIPLTFAHDSISGPNLAGLHGSEPCRNVVNSILANESDPANTSIMVGYLC